MHKLVLIETRSSASHRIFLFQQGGAAVTLNHRLVPLRPLLPADDQSQPNRARLDGFVAKEKH